METIVIYESQENSKKLDECSVDELKALIKRLSFELDFTRKQLHGKYKQ